MSHYTLKGIVPNALFLATNLLALIIRVPHPLDFITATHCFERDSELTRISWDNLLLQIAMCVTTTITSDDYTVIYNVERDSYEVTDTDGDLPFEPRWYIVAVRERALRNRARHLALIVVNFTRSDDLEGL